MEGGKERDGGREVKRNRWRDGSERGREGKTEGEGGRKEGRRDGGREGGREREDGMSDFETWLRS